jgi:hypothetical protein
LLAFEELELLEFKPRTLLFTTEIKPVDKLTSYYFVTMRVKECVLCALSGKGKASS